jgi:hypothetical protein
MTDSVLNCIVPLGRKQTAVGRDYSNKVKDVLAFAFRARKETARVKQSNKRISIQVTKKGRQVVPDGLR